MNTPEKIETGEALMIRRSLNTTGTLHVAEDWRDGVRTYIAWFTFAPGRVGHGETREDAIRDIPQRKAVS